jgi:hypothetical protein
MESSWSLASAATRRAIALVFRDASMSRLSAAGRRISKVVLRSSHVTEVPADRKRLTMSNTSFVRGMLVKMTDSVAMLPFVVFNPDS